MATVPAIKPPAPRPYFTATSCGEFIEGDVDLERLLRILREEIMDPGSDNDVVVTAGGRVAAVIRGEDLQVVFTR